MKNGKKICETLKQIRLDIARENGIEYTPSECHHEGDCAGTCPACDSELMYLEREISRKRSFGKVAVVGISIGLASLSLTSCMGTDPVQDQIVAGSIEKVDTPVLEGMVDNAQTRIFVDSIDFEEPSHE